MAQLREKLSASAINRWYNCPYSYKCRYIERCPTIKTPDTFTFGLTVHNCIDHYYDTISKKTQISEVHDLLEKAFTSGGNYSTTSRKKSTRKAINSVEKFEKKRIRKHIPPPTIREEMLEAKLRDDLPLLYGKPDAYFEETGEIIDWKTGKHAIVTDSLKVQGKMYELILKAHGYHPKKIIFDFVVLGKRVFLPRVSEGWFIKQIEDMCNNVTKDRFRPNPGFLCNRWCEYKLSCDLRNKCKWVIP